MKKILLLAACLCATLITKAQYWETNLNTITVTDGNSNLGTKNDYPINFYTNDTLRMVLGLGGKLKINKLGCAGSPGTRLMKAENDGTLDVWIGAACDSGKVLFGDNTWRTMPLRTAPAVGGNPDIVIIGDPQGAIGWKPPCNTWNPTKGTLTYDLIQVQKTGGGSSVLNMGVTTIGDGIIAVEAVTPPGSQKLRLNPSCNNDVEICQGGGFTKLYNNASVGKNLRVGPGGSVPTGSQLDIVLDPASTRGLTIIDPALSSTNKNIFEVSKTGETILGLDVQPVSGCMLTVGQPVFNTLAMSLTDNSSSPNLPFFNVYGGGFTEILVSGSQAVSVKNRSNSSVETFGVDANGYTHINTVNTKAFSVFNASNSSNEAFTIGKNGYTEIKSTNTKAFSIYNPNNSNNETFFVNANGYTEIKVYSPSGMPTPYSSGKRAMTIRDMTNNKDIFVVNSNGTVYAREVEISLTTNFPDYVFEKGYDLKPISTLEQYIEKNKHLPGFENAEHYEKNGININTMLVKQQEKIEELTLYIIQLEKRLQAIEKK